MFFWRALLEVTVAECRTQSLQAGQLRAVTPLRPARPRALGSPCPSIGHQSKSVFLWWKWCPGAAAGLGFCTFLGCSRRSLLLRHSDEQPAVRLGSRGMPGAPEGCLGLRRDAWGSLPLPGSSLGVLSPGYLLGLPEPLAVSAGCCS